MKAGDRVRVVKVPPGLRDDDDLCTKRLFGLCLGQTFPIVGFDGGLIELHVGVMFGEPPFRQMIWIEPEYVELIKNQTDPLPGL